VLTPNATRRPVRKAFYGRTDEADALELAKRLFPHQLFTAEYLATNLPCDVKTAQKWVQNWTTEAGAYRLYRWQSKPGDPLTEYTFDPTMAGTRELADTESNREKYGYINPDQTSTKGTLILNKGLRADSPQPAPHDDSTYDSMQGGSRTTNPVYMNFPRVGLNAEGTRRTLAVLGHMYPAVMNWNYGTGGSTAGHKRPKADNKDWNQDTDNYWGPEHYKESGEEGGTIGETYVVPRQSIGSHESWWKV
jgi:hypothetical protein